MRPCWYAFQGVACILSPYGAFTEIPPALPGDVYFYPLLTGIKFSTVLSISIIAEQRCG